MFTSHDPSKMSEPPQERKFSSTPRTKFRSNQVHQIEDVYGDDPEEAEEVEPDPYEDEYNLQEGEEADQASEDGEEASVTGEDEQEGATATFLAGVSMDRTGKRPPPCYMFASVDPVGI